MSSLNSLMNIGNSALSSTQTAIHTTGNNIANMNTVGYSRQNVLFEDRYAQCGIPGTLGQGVNVQGIYRNFNRFLENSYLDRFSQQNRWSEQNNILETVEAVFNEANSDGINNAMNNFFNGWNTLVTNDLDASRIDLLSNAQQLSSVITNSAQSLKDMQHEMESYIAQSVDEINELIENIKDLNKQISMHSGAGENPNQLLDARDIKVRDLASLIDIDVIQREGDFTILTKSGHTLVQGADSSFSLKVGGDRIEKHLKNPNDPKSYKGTIEISGSSSHEYLFEIVTPPATGKNGTMRVSLDGGKSWVKDDAGKILEVEIPEQPSTQNNPFPIYLNDTNITVSFTNGDPTTLVQGDRFEAITKTSVYWVDPTREPLNVTPMVMGDGTDNTNRLTGGKLSAYFNVKDATIGSYLERLDALSKSLTWEVNSLHSIGSNKTMTEVMGTYKAGYADKPLGKNTSGLDFYNRLTEGNLSFQIYKNGKTASDDGVLVDQPVFSQIQFDPQKDSLQDIAQQITACYTDQNYTYLTASVTADNRLSLKAAEGYSFIVADDTSGLLAALGINTFFTGSTASDLAVNDIIAQDTDRINRGKVQPYGNNTEGDHSVASNMWDLSTKQVKISTPWETRKDQTLSDYYGSTVSLVGTDKRTAQFNTDYNTTLAEDLDAQCSAISGVNIDEEMINLIKYQHSYTAAAKLITTADEMMQTLLSLKQ